MPGGALAVADHGKLVVAKGYGWANIAAHQPVTAESLFCLASVSKVVTGVAVLRLVQEGKLKLDDRAYFLLGRPLPLEGFQLDPRVREITVRQLLLHAGGFDPKQGGDYLQAAKKIAKETGQKLPISAEFLLHYALSSQLGYTPGKEEHYSNFGFFLLSEVIEKVSGQPYEQYVRQHVLRPADITGMERERLRPHYYSHEAHRYGPDGLKEFPGGRGPIGPPAGSWIASAVDMAKLLVAIDGSRGTRLLSPAVYKEMLAPPPPPLAVRADGSHFGLGWDVVLPVGGDFRFSKNGGVPGIHTYVEHMPGGVDWVVLLNGGDRRPGKPSALGYCTKHIRQAIQQTKRWPPRDLFEHPRPAARPSGTQMATM